MINQLCAYNMYHLLKHRKVLQIRFRPGPDVQESAWEKYVEWSGAGGSGGGGGWEKMRFSYGRRNVHSVKQNIKLYYRIKIPRGIFDKQCSSLMAYLQFKK